MANLHNLKKGYSEITDLKDMTATAAEVNTLDGAVAAVVYTIGAEAANAITINIQLNDANGVALAKRAALKFFLSDDANGDSIATTAPDGGIAAGTDGFIEAITANKSFFGHSEADGDIDVVITESGAATWYLVAVLPNGSYDASAAIAFTT